MPRNYSSEITISQHGRAYGVQFMSSAKSGSTRDRYQFLSGPDDYRVGVTTNDTTGVNLHPFGVHRLTSGSSAVHTLNPPIPGVKVVVFTTGGSTAYLKTRNGETVESSRGSSFNTLQFNAYGVAELYGYTTGRWVLLNGGDSGTSSQSPAIALATST